MANSIKNFDWSVLNRNSIIMLISTLAPEIVKQPLTVEQFHKKITTLLKKHLPVRGLLLSQTRFEFVTIFLSDDIHQLQTPNKQ